MLILTFNSLTGCDQARKYVDQYKPIKTFAFAFNNCKSIKKLKPWVILILAIGRKWSWT